MGYVARPYGMGGSRKYMLASLDESLQRMGLDYVDIYYSHKPDMDVPLEETMGALVTPSTRARPYMSASRRTTPTVPAKPQRFWRWKAFRC